MTTMIKLDLDGKDKRRWRYHMRRLRWMIGQVMSILNQHGQKCVLRPVQVDSTKKGYHVRIEAEGLSELEKVLLQAVLGSDPIREVLNHG